MATRAWIITGGTDTGVMKLVGEAMREKDNHAVPVIGIGPWGATNGRGVSDTLPASESPRAPRSRDRGDQRGCGTRATPLLTCSCVAHRADKLAEAEGARVNYFASTPMECRSTRR
jgi:hypothetical protein